MPRASNCFCNLNRLCKITHHVAKHGDKGDGREKSVLLGHGLADDANLPQSRPHGEVIRDGTIAVQRGPKDVSLKSMVRSGNPGGRRVVGAGSLLPDAGAYAVRASSRSTVTNSPDPFPRSEFVLWLLLSALSRSATLLTIPVPVHEAHIIPACYAVMNLVLSVIDWCSQQTGVFPLRQPSQRSHAASPRSPTLRC